MLALDVSDINLVSGEVLIRQGKSKKPRYVYIGKHTRIALRKYLRSRLDDIPALWVTYPCLDSTRLTYSGLRSMVKRRAKQAGVEAPTLRSFRRAFALSMLRNGTFT